MQNQMNQNQPLTSANESRTAAEGTAKLADKAEHAVDQVKSAAIEHVQTVREQAKSGIDQGRNQIADRIRNVSSALRSASENLRQEDEFIAEYVDRAGERIESVASYVTSADPRTMIRDVERLARQRPAWFFGGAFLLGLAAGRFLKASGGRLESETLELDEADLEDLPRTGYRGDAYRRQQAYAQPITPSATIPVTQGSQPRTTRAGAASASRSAAGFTPSSGVSSTGTGSSTSSSSSSESGLSSSELGHRPNDIFDAPVPATRTETNRS